MLRMMLKRCQGEEKECGRELQGRGNQATGEAYPYSTIASNLFATRGGTRERERAEARLPSGMSTDKGTGVIRHIAKATKGRTRGAGGTDASEFNDTGLKGIRHIRANRDESGPTTEGKKTAD